MSKKKSFTYASAGVDIDKADAAKSKIKSLIESTFNDKVVGGFGHFGGCYSGKFKGFDDPITVSSSDGVGTKIKIACMMKKYDSVGIDIVHHCVNDIAVMGAHPQFFLDYIGIGKLEPGTIEEILKGLVAGCKNANMALIAGETAEMPDLYRPGEFDLAGFIVGVVDRSKIIDGSKIEAGDVVLGFKSNGLHTNGYTLARKIAFEHMGWNPDKHFDELGMSIGEALLTPHKLYLPAIEKLRDKSSVKGFAHVTGGGIVGNLSRIFRDGLSFDIDTSKWEIPPVFTILQEAGNVEKSEMFRAFNMGIGLTCIVSEDGVGEIVDSFSDSEDKPIVIGRVVEGKEPQLNLD
ncbi:MAG: phosphoribosylformylglycinamidine cyclo-ligase [candidate division Zixibacteria bacterium]|nr:phosphoribosylformylglycinamidine cyclo-ligase [candidate division Zixibacteria bacterium]